MSEKCAIPFELPQRDRIWHMKVMKRISALTPQQF